VSIVVAMWRRLVEFYALGVSRASLAAFVLLERAVQQSWFEENDPEGAAFEYEVLE
jgi:hypothetical protein